jgi:hypothetical protein
LVIRKNIVGKGGQIIRQPNNLFTVVHIPLDNFPELAHGSVTRIDSSTTGLGVCIWYLLRGLTEKITSLEGVIVAQKQTIEVMDKRIEETEKIGEAH